MRKRISGPRARRPAPGFPHRLRTAMEHAGLAQTRLAERLGVTQSTVSRYLKGSVPSGETLFRLAEILAVSPGWLVTGQGDAERPSAALDAPGPLRRVPVISHTQAGREGFWLDSHEPGTGDEYVWDACRDPACYALRVEGDSMVPRVRPGELVVVSPSTPPAPGDLAVVRLRETGEVLLKEWRKKDGLVFLSSFNPSVEPIVVRPRQIAFAHKVVSIRMG